MYVDNIHPKSGSTDLLIATGVGRKITLNPSSTGVTIIPEGNVGIGTALPLAKLHINGGVGTLATGLAFGDGDTGFYESADDSISVSLAGSNAWRFHNNGWFDGNITNGPRMQRETSTITNPVFTSSSDEDTGVGYDNANGLALITGGVAGLFIDASQNVGIGTTTPSNKLSLELSETSTTQSSFKGMVLSNTDTTVNNGVAISFSNTASSSNSHSKIGAIYEDRTGGSEDTSLFFGTLGGGVYSERMRITSSGNVGIGTTTPVATLQVGAITATEMSQVVGKARIVGPNYIPSSTQMGTLDIASTTINSSAPFNQGFGPSLTFSQNISGYSDGYEVVVGAIKSIVTSDSNTGQESAMTFLVNGGFGYGVSERMRIDNAGNVGIGTVTPSAFDTTDTKLHIKNAGSSGSVSEVARLEGSSDADGSGAILRIGTSNDRGTYLEGGRNGAAPYASIGTTEYNGAKTEGIRITSTGNVGIGTTSPSAKLEISGGHIRLADAYSLQWGSANNRIYNQSGDTAFVNSAVERMRIDSTGSVGIGTTTPTSKLQVDGGIQMADDADAASADKEGTMRYRKDYIEKGSELILDGDFSSVPGAPPVTPTPSDWTKETGWTISGGTANCLNGVGVSIYQTNRVVIGKQYKLTFSVSNYSQGYLGSIANDFGAVVAEADGSYELYGTATSTTFGLTAFSNFIGSIDNVSVKEVTGNSYVDMCMKTGETTYAWTNITQNNW